MENDVPEAHQLLLFLAAGWLLNLTPGPDVLYIVTNALRRGVRAGLVAGLGITAGCCIHVVGAALGLGALLSTSAVAFSVVKWLGAAYLVWIGVRALMVRAPKQHTDLQALAHNQSPTSMRRIFLGGFWTNVLNPKVAIFFLAFVPQFIAPDASHKTLAFLALGILFNINSIPVNAGWALGAAWVARHDSVQRGMHWLDKIAGAMFVLFGLKLALSDNPSR
jgi:RhtB (resistance to homoserine/threonine) family protein